MAEIQKVLTGQSTCVDDTADMGYDGFQSSGDELTPQAGLVASKDSVGSLLHSEGTCKPCAWFWKPQGCRNGKDCLHCHLCPCSEIKERKKKQFARLQEEGSLKSTESSAASTTPSPSRVSPLAWLAPPGLTPTSDDDKSGAFPFLGPPEFEDEPRKVSRGSELHGTGECKPCAWFWHPKSCSNGWDCKFCHICPQGELKARRKLKVLKLRQESAQEMAEQMEQMPQDPQLPGAVSEMDVMHLENLCDMQGATAKLEADLHANDGSPVKVMFAESWPSLGSRQHGSGQCRPCAWFWKKGCQNGRDCLHCHLCPEGELRRKKKEAAKLRSAPRDVRQIADALTLQQRIIQQQQHRLVDLQLQLQFQQQLMATASMSSFGPDSSYASFGQ